MDCQSKEVGIQRHLNQPAQSTDMPLYDHGSKPPIQRNTLTGLNTMDMALQAHTPVVVVPRFEALAPMTTNGHRFLVTHDGLWIEARRPWVQIVWPICLHSNAVSMPFGHLERKVRFAFGRLPMWVLEQFTVQAIQAHPNETGAVAIWNNRDKIIRYHQCETLVAGIGHLKEQWPTLGPDESVAVDMHSHGPIGAFFSDVDRRDMGSDVVVGLVVGKTDTATPEVAISLFACGLEIKVEIPTMGSQQQGEALPEMDLEDTSKSVF